jgi:16S rRNA G966 N2-methylase RsmD
MEELKAHEYANLFPMMGEVELSALVDDMRKNGFDETSPIVMARGKILDGRNRYRASQLAGIKPDFIEYDGDDPLGFVLRHNLNRRHLNETQRAGVAAKIANMNEGRPQKNSPNLESKFSIPQAAAMLNVGKSTVATYKAVAAAMPELIEKMDRGEMTAHEAEKKVKEVKRTVARAEIAQAGAQVKTSDKWHVYHGDISTWKAPRQYDFIITDPPYPKEYLPLWEVLARRASEWLKPNGMLIAMTPHFHLDKIMEMMGKHLTFYWIAAYLVPGESAGVAQRRINPQWKPLLIYAPSNYTGKTFSDVFISGENDKDHHKWGQSISGMSSIIDKVCLEGQTILDPFCGAGTTGIAALKHGCLFDGLDVDVENVNISKGRLQDVIR